MVYGFFLVIRSAFIGLGLYVAEMGGIMHPIKENLGELERIKCLIVPESKKKKKKKKLKL